MIDIGFVRQLINLIPLPLETRASAYLTAGEAMQGHAGSMAAGGIWFLQLNRVFLEAFFIGLISWMMWRRSYRCSALLSDVLVFSMLAYGVINLVAYIPSLGRFYTIPQMLMLAATVLFLSQPKVARPLDKQIISLASPLLAINVALGVRLMLGYSTVWLFVGNIFLAPFAEASISAYDAIMAFLFGREPTFA